jgi:hypothetical protein
MGVNILKIKEAIKKYNIAANKQEKDEFLSSFLTSLFFDIKNLFNSRKPSHGCSMLSIFNEVYGKWQSFCNKTGVEERLFKEEMGKTLQEIYRFWSELEASTCHTKEKYELGVSSGLITF